ncbi:hypothetical protein ACXIVK_27730 [Paraburkholderia caledonica]
MNSKIEVNTSADCAVNRRQFSHVGYHATRSLEAFQRFNWSSTGAQGPGIYLSDRLASASQYGGGRMVSVPMANMLA